MKNKQNKTKPKVHKELKGFNIEIDSFGGVSSNMNLDSLNAFLDKKVKDKKVSDGKKK